MAKRQKAREKKKEKDNGVVQAQYVMSQNPFDFQIAFLSVL
jgi:hypothetical protein